jgi:hypothetical protein
MGRFSKLQGSGPILLNWLLDFCNSWQSLMAPQLICGGHHIGGLMMSPSASPDNDPLYRQSGNIQRLSHAW